MTEQVRDVMPGVWAAVGGLWRPAPTWLLIRRDELNHDVPVEVVIGADPDMLLINCVTPGILLRATPPDPFPACDTQNLSARVAEHQTRDLSSEYATRDLRERLADDAG